MDNNVCSCPPEAGKAVCELNVATISDATSPLNACPLNGQKGKLVEQQTIKALLKASLRLVEQTQYFFCTDPACEVVYFSANGTQTFTTAQLRESVFQKEPDNLAVPVCYCFQHSVGTLQLGSSLQRQGIVEDIRQGIAAGQCACDLRNPQGSCCLGNVIKLVKQLEG